MTGKENEVDAILAISRRRGLNYLAVPISSVIKGSRLMCSDAFKTFLHSNNFSFLPLLKVSLIRHWSTRPV